MGTTCTNALGREGALDGLKKGARGERDEEGARGGEEAARQQPDPAGPPGPWPAGLGLLRVP